MGMQAFGKMVRSLATRMGWHVRRVSKSKSSQYIYLEKKVYLTIRISDHPTKMGGVYSIESASGTFKEFDSIEKETLITLLRNPFANSINKRKKPRFPPSN